MTKAQGKICLRRVSRENVTHAKRNVIAEAQSKIYPKCVSQENVTHVKRNMS
ncbi:hypothetical protein BHM03_00010950 [Ensete ventricosum]|nr:hypothetical protein BHM03_00010950 [Ensete ventricosum]